MRLVNRTVTSLACMLMIFLLQGCAGGYSFTGVSLPPSIQTITVDNFFNDTGSGPPNLMQILTERTRDYYIRNTNLALVNSDGDLQLEGNIIGWTLSPVAPTATGGNNAPDRAGLQRLTITVKVNFINTQDETQSFSKNFSFYDDYDPSVTDLTAEEPRLIDTIFEAIVFDIFNSTVANW
jgi:hypothetical protein